MSPTSNANEVKTSATEGIVSGNRCVRKLGSRGASGHVTSFLQRNSTMGEGPDSMSTSFVPIGVNWRFFVCLLQHHALGDKYASKVQDQPEESHGEFQCVRYQRRRILDLESAPDIVKVAQDGHCARLSGGWITEWQSIVLAAI